MKEEKKYLACELDRNVIDELWQISTDENIPFPSLIEKILLEYISDRAKARAK